MRGVRLIDRELLVLKCCQQIHSIICALDADGPVGKVADQPKRVRYLSGSSRTLGVLDPSDQTAIRQAIAAVLG
jgi:hypothetical protein